jgi:hypothetical protein
MEDTRDKVIKIIEEYAERMQRDKYEVDKLFIHIGDMKRDIKYLEWGFCTHNICTECMSKILKTEADINEA